MTLYQPLLGAHPPVTSDNVFTVDSELSQFEYGAFMARFQISKAPQIAGLCKLLFLFRNLAPRAGLEPATN